MSALLHIANQLQETHAAIWLAEKHLTVSPGSAALRLSVSSLYQKQESLQAEFDQISADQGLDVCRYRLIPENGSSYDLRAVSTALKDFQELVTIIYDSVRSGKPKNRMKTGVRAVRESSFDFGYVFAGSLGFVFSIPNERLLAVETQLDMAIKKTFDLIKLQEVELVTEFAENVGAAPIRKAYTWAENHISAGLTADLKWQREGQDRASVLVQPTEFIRFTETIDKLGDEITRRLDGPGILLGADTKSKRFHVVLDSGQDLRGQYKRDLRLPVPLILDRRYSFRIAQTAKVRIAGETKDETNELIGIQPLQD